MINAEVAMLSNMQSSRARQSLGDTHIVVLSLDHRTCHIPADAILGVLEPNLAWESHWDTPSPGQATGQHRSYQLCKLASGVHLQPFGVAGEHGLALPCPSLMHDCSQHVYRPSE